MIRSSSVSLKLANTDKLSQLARFIEEYRRVVTVFIDLLWERSATESIPALLPRHITSQISTWLSSRAIQAAGKQASGIIRGTRQKQKQRLYVYQKLLDGGRNREADRLKKLIDQTDIGKPDVSNVCPELDSRFIRVDIFNQTSFDGWLTLGSLGGGLKISLPFRSTKHLNSLLLTGKLLGGCRLSPTKATFNFELPDPPAVNEGQTLGIDVGVKKVFVTSSGQMSTADRHGHTLDSICAKLARRKKGSAGFRAAQQHRTNYIGWSLNHLNLAGVKKIRIENIKHLRLGRNPGRRLSHFTYTEIFRKIEDLATRSGVQIERIDPQFTSQRCSCCGWVRSTNRSGEYFRCDNCGYAADADLNAATNIGTELPALPARSALDNQKGFFWSGRTGEPIVPLTQ